MAADSIGGWNDLLLLFGIIQQQQQQAYDKLTCLSAFLSLTADGSIDFDWMEIFCFAWKKA